MTQQKNNHRSNQTESYTFVQNSQTLTLSHFYPYGMVFKGKPRVPIEFHLKFTRDQNSICASSFCRYLATQNTLTDQNKIVQPLITKPMLKETLQIKKSVFYIFSCRNLTIKEKLLT